MNDQALDHDKAAHHAGLTTAVLHVIDACQHTLQRLRDRVETPVADVEPPRHGARHPRAEPVAAPAPAAPTVPKKHFVPRALVLLACLALGGGGGALMSYRTFSQMLDTQATMIDSMQDEIDQSRKQDALNLKATARQINELAEYRKQLRETRQEVADQEARIEELNAQLTALKKVEKPAPPPLRPTRAAAKAQPAARGGVCVTGTGNVTGDLADCLKGFNRP